MPRDQRGQMFNVLTYHTGIALLGMELREVILALVNTRIGSRIHGCVVVSEKETRCICLVNIVVEITSASHRHRIPVESIYQFRLVIVW
jgi:hypothetical protein